MLSRYFNTENGGIGRYSKELLSKMMENGHKVNPVQTLSDGGIGYSYYTLVHLYKKLNFFNRGCDVYHALTPMESIYAPKERTVTTFHDLIPVLYPDSQNWHGGFLPDSLSKLLGIKIFEFGIRKGCCYG